MIASTAISAKHIQPPVNDQDFEITLIDVANIFFDSTTFERYGKKGSTQHGIDVRGRPKDDARKLFVIQGKCREPGKKEKPEDVESHVKQALKKFTFQRFIYATTAGKQTALQDAANTLQEQLNKNMGDDAPLIQIWDWDSLTDMGRNNPDILRALDKQYAATLGALEYLRVEKPELLEEYKNGVLDGFLPARRQNTLIEIRTIDSYDNAEEHSDEIGAASKLILTAPKEALKVFQVLLASKTEFDAKNLARIHGGIGNCHFLLEDRKPAFEHYEAAYNYKADRSPAIANYALKLGFEGQLDKLENFAKIELNKDPQNATLAARALYFLQDETIIPNSVLKNEHVWLARLEFQRKSGAKVDLIVNSREALRTHHSNFSLRQFLADTLLEKVLVEKGVHGFTPFSDEAASFLEETKGLYSDLWKELTKTQNYQQLTDPALPTNYMQALRVSGEFEQAIEIGRNALQSTAGHSSVALELAINLMEIGNAEELAGVIDKLPPDHLDADKVRLQHAMNNSDWGVVDSLCEKRIKASDKTDRDLGLLLGIRSLARIEQLPEGKREEEVSKLIETESEECREWTIRIQLARKYLGFDAASSCLELVKKYISDTSKVEDILSVAREAYVLGDIDTVFSLLQDKIDYSRPSEALNNLLKIAAEENPVRQRSVDVYNKLSPKLLSDLFYKELAAIAAFNRRDFPLAKQYFEELLSKQAKLKFWLGLYRSLMRVGNDDDLDALLLRANLMSLEHSPRDSMELATILKHHGKLDDAIAIAFRAISSPEGQNSAIVSGSYVGFVFTMEEQPEISRKVHKGQYVRIRKVDGKEVVEGIIGGKIHQPWGQILQETDQRISPFIGKGLGDKANIKTKLKDESHWVIEDVWPEYIRAAQYLSSEHTDKFGEAAIVYKIVTEEDNVEPLLDMVREQGQFVDNVCRTVVEKGLPLTFMGGDNDVGGLGLANALRQRGYNIPTSLGTKEAQNKAQETIQDLCNGVAIDLFTAMTAIELSVLAPLSRLLGPIRISENELDAFRNHIAIAKSSKSQSMRLSSKEGQVYRDEVNSNDNKAQLEWLDEALSQLTEYCNVEPVIYSDDQSEIEQLILDEVPITLAPIELAKQNNVPLLSEDGSLRNLANQLGVQGELWLSACLKEATDKKEITAKQHMQATLGLVQRKHEFVPVTANILASAINEFSKNELGYEAELLIGQLGGVNAGIISNVGVAASFFQLIRKNETSEEIRLAAMDQVARSILSGTSARSALLWAKAFGRALHPDDADEFAEACKKYIPEINLNYKTFDKRPLFNSVSVLALMASIDSREYVN